MQILDRKVIKLGGRDCYKFLQSISTNNVLVENELGYNLTINTQGQLVADFFAIYFADHILLDISTKLADSMIEHFNKYKLRAKIEFADLPYKVIYTKNKPMVDNIVSYKDPRFDDLGYRSIVDLAPKEHGFEYLEDKYEFAIPDGDIDMIIGKSFPQEFGLDNLNGISYNKGCYLGQEFISRTKSQGVIRKKIYKIVADQDISSTSPLTSIMAGENKIGNLCSSYKNVGLALIREPDYRQNEQMALTINDLSIRLEKPKWQEQ